MRFTDYEINVSSLSASPNLEKILVEKNLEKILENFKTQKNYLMRVLCTGSQQPWDSDEWNKLVKKSSSIKESRKQQR